MARIMITCPATKKPLPTGIDATPEAFKKSTFVNNATGCPHCGQMHTWSKKDAFLEKK